MRPAPARGRVKRSPGPLQWLALLTAGAVIMALTFTLGVLVGRQWSSPAPAESLARKTVPPGKRGGLSTAEVESSPSVDQKLTFYQTLTAPLGRGSADASQRAEAKAHPAEAKAQPAPEPVRAEPSPPPNPYASRGETFVEKPAAPVAAAPPARAQADAAGFWAGLWSVQVGAFKTQGQAASLHKQLREAGFDAYIAPTVTSNGQTNYRVRVGTFKSKAEAQLLAERMRGERSLAAFVTPR